MVFIHETKGWPKFSWDAGAVLPSLGRARHKQGLLLGEMRHLGFDLRAEAAVEVLTSDIVRSSAIEGERLDAEAAEGPAVATVAADRRRWPPRRSAMRRSRAESW